MGRILIALIGLLPASRLKNLGLRRLGWAIGRSTSIGPGLYWSIASVTIGSSARIGPFNVVRGLAKLSMGDRARMGQWNWVSASGPLVDAGSAGALVVGEDSAITARHYIDASGGVTIGHHTTVAGVRSTFVTHGIDWRASRQRTRRISIGDYCIVSSNVSIAPGTSVASRVVVGMGAVLAGDVGPEGVLVVGGRGAAVKYGLTGEYFTRDVGYIGEIEGGSADGAAHTP